MTMRKKEEVVMDLEAYLQYKHNTIGKPPRLIHSDNAKEYLSAAVAAILQNAGTHLRTTVPHTTEENGIAQKIFIAPSWMVLDAS